MEKIGFTNTRDVVFKIKNLTVLDSILGYYVRIFIYLFFQDLGVGISSHQIFYVNYAVC